MFLVPLEDGGVARGVVARSTAKGKVLLGYFFGPRLAPDAARRMVDPDPADAVLRVICGDLGLMNGRWQVLGNIANWNRAKWPMPAFVRKDPFGQRRPLLVRYSDDDPTELESETPIDCDEGLQVDAVYGYGAVAIRLNCLLPPSTV
jgi:Immunity protein 26